MRLVRLESLRDPAKPMHIDVSRIAAIDAGVDGEGSVIYVNGGIKFLVRETPDEVAQKAREAYHAEDGV